MNVKRLALLIILLALVFLSLAPVPAHAGGQKWSAWAYDQNTGDLYLFTDTITTPQITQLPLPSGFKEYPFMVAISHDWHYAAYMVSDENTGGTKSALVVYDRNNGKLAFSRSMSKVLSLDYFAGENAFNETNTSIALGYSFDNPDKGGWEIKTYNLPDGSPGPNLRSTDPVAVAAHLPSNYFMTPVIRNYQGSQVSFLMVQGAADGSPKYDSYIWDMTANTITPIQAYPTISSDLLQATGETISAQDDVRFPLCAACQTMIATNILTVFDPATKTLAPFYTNSKVFRGPIFIQGGERVLFSETTTDVDYQYGVIERNGTLVGYVPGLGPAALMSYIGWQDGFLYTTSASNSSTGKAALYAVNTRNGLNAGTLIWQADNSKVELRLIQTPGNMQSKGPFAAWQVLNPSKVSPGKLIIGEKATVQTTQGDKLRMRSGPSKIAPVVKLLDNGTVVTIVEGPVKADDLTWWRIREPGGAEGWVVESVEDNGQMLQTLLPA